MARDRLDVQAEHARRILEDPLFVGAFTSLREQAVQSLEALEGAGTPYDERALEGVRRLRTLARLKSEFTEVLRAQGLRDKKRKIEEEEKERRTAKVRPLRKK